MKKGLWLSLLGIVLLLTGLVLELHGGPSKADGQLVQACQNEMKRREAGPDMIARCSDTAFATMTTATNAESAARSISAANNQEVGSNMTAMFLIGFGITLTFAGILFYRRTIDSEA